ncbi:MAG: hypothetical protein Q9M94_00815 [Candidatus Gracilibacteria bacterium]|nr:hypothetical protein [Candidatus Gracilibacteria bacterium]MDQ7022439.1 hypothetical protein [Candidatus Gracilibacteria bacterium]
MLNVIIEDSVSLKIDNFLESYSNIFLNRFSDTGIFDEEKIRNNFILSVKNIRNNIFSEIEKEFVQEEIYGYKPLEKSKYQYYIAIEKPKYSLKIEYSEDLKNKIRFIEKIEFNKR